MKTLSATIIILLISLASFSQMKTLFHGMPYESIYTVKDSIKHNLQHYGGLYNYVFNEKSQQFVFTDSLNNPVKLSFTKRATDQNGWVIDEVQISGAYINLFPIWETYISNDVDFIETAKHTQEVRFKDVATKKEIIIKFVKGKVWMIRLYAYPMN